MLIGVVQADGRIGYLGEPIPVDAAFVSKAGAGRTPERRFRFANACVECSCRQWTGTGCGVIEKSLGEIPAAAEGEIPACGLRAHCRWHRQSGVAACHVCPLIVTETRAPVPAAP